MILIFTILWNALEAIADGLYDKGKKTISGVIEFIGKLVGIFTVAYVTYGITVYTIDIPVWKIILGFVFVRFLIFDYIYNITRGLEFEYIGNTKLYDKFLQKVPWHYLLFIKTICGIVGISFLLNL